MKETYASNELPVYEYIPIADKVLVRINKFDHMEESTGESGETYSQYVYLTNEFTINKGEISEEEIAADPLSYLDYNESEYTLSARVEAMESAIDFLLMGGI